MTGQRLICSHRNLNGAVCRAQLRAAVTVRTDARGWPTTYTQDPVGRTVGVEYFGGSRATFTFDAAGRQTTMQDATGITTYTMDAVGQRTNVLDFMGTPITYQFDPAGNRTYMKDPPGHYWTYTWDPDGRLAAVWNSYGQFTTLAHDPLGRETQRVLANGVNIQRTFDPAGRETVLSELKPDGSALQVYTASYDPVGNRLGVQEYDGTLVTYAHDAAYQLVCEQRGGAHAFDTNLEYDAAGNRITKVDASGTTNYQHNAANELVLTTPPSGAPTTSTWDADGNLAVEIAGAQRTTYAWDGENRLTHIDLPSGATEDNTYRADGLRRSHTTMDGTTLFVLDEQNVLLETGDTGAIYTQLPGIWGGAFSVKRGSATEYLVADLQGHTRYRTTAAAAVNDEVLCDAWGREVWAWGTHTNMLKAFGQFGYWRDSAERSYVRARHLRVELGRWLSRDPLGVMSRARPRYRYVANSPTMAEDPSGLAASCRRCQDICKNGHSPALAEECDRCWSTCEMQCEEWGNPLEPPVGCPADTVPVFVTCYKPKRNEVGRCAVYCSTKFCRSCHSISPGSDRPLCDASQGVRLIVPGIAVGTGDCIASNAGCGQHPKDRHERPNLPVPNDWIDYPDPNCVDPHKWKCWVCMHLPSGCQSSRVNPPLPSPIC